MSDINLKLLLVAFSEFNLWDVKRYLTNDIESKYSIVRLGDYITQRNKKLNLSDFPDKNFGILGVNNQTGIFDAYTEKGENINQSYKLVMNGDLAYNPYRVNVGSIGMKTDKHKNSYISPAYIVFECKSGLNPEFLYRLFKTSTFNQIIRDNTTGSVRQNLKYDILENIRIPLPSMKEQQRLLDAFSHKNSMAISQLQQATALEYDIQNYILDILGIEKSVEGKEGLDLNFINFRLLDLWDVNRVLHGNSNILKSNKYPNSKLGNLVDVNPKTDLSNLSDNAEMTFLPMKNISDEYGEIITKDKGIKSNSKGYTKFQENDLLWARITPCMQNGKSAIVSDLKNKVGYGSTEYHVLRQKDENLNIRFVYHLLRTQLVLQDATNYFTGSSGQQRVPKSYLENLIIPTPPIEIQDEIDHHISQLKSEIKQLKQQAEYNRQTAITDFEKEIFSHEHH